MASAASYHTTMAVLALTLLVAWGAYQVGYGPEETTAPIQATIAVEHAAAAGLSISHSIGGSIHTVDITNDSAEPMKVSIPSSWERGEVRQVPLESVVSGQANLGFRGWTLPAKASVSFKADGDMQTLEIHNPSGILLRVRVITINLQKNTTETEAYLLQKSPLTLSF